MPAAADATLCRRQRPRANEDRGRVAKASSQGAHLNSPRAAHRPRLPILRLGAVACTCYPCRLRDRGISSPFGASRVLLVSRRSDRRQRPTPPPPGVSRRQLRGKGAAASRRTWSCCLFKLSISWGAHEPCLFRIVAVVSVSALWMPYSLDPPSRIKTKGRCEADMPVRRQKHQPRSHSLLPSARANIKTPFFKTSCEGDAPCPPLPFFLGLTL